ncbi:copper amine oxidase N-terminal domain-containing protein, partial [Peptococcaceae bacterium]|nr:copper amine oxidase N-terminal domain-containing protein [Peptococcaceae bacterium]
RFLGNALGVPDEQIEWDGTTSTATLTRGQYTIALTIGNKTALRNGVEYRMDVSPQLAEGRTQLPARFVAEGLGYNVAWCSERQIVIVYTGDTVPEVTKLPEAELPAPVFEGDTVEIDGWVIPAGERTARYGSYVRFYNGLLINYPSQPDRTAFLMGILLGSDSLEQDIAKAREILSQRFTDSQVDQIMDPLEYALITKRCVRGLEIETFIFNNIRVHIGRAIFDTGVYIDVWRESPPKGDTVEIDGWVLPAGEPTHAYGFYYIRNGLEIDYSTLPDRSAFTIGIYLRSDTLEQDIVQAREILSQRFTKSQVNQIMNRLEYSLVTKRSVRGLETETYMFNNIRVDSGRIGNNIGVFIRVWREGQF